MLTALLGGGVYAAGQAESDHTGVAHTGTGLREHQEWAAPMGGGHGLDMGGWVQQAWTQKARPGWVGAWGELGPVG